MVKASQDNTLKVCHFGGFSQHSSALRPRHEWGHLHTYRAVPIVRRFGKQLVSILSALVLVVLGRFAFSTCHLPLHSNKNNHLA